PVAGVALSTQGVYNTNLSVGSSPAYGYSFYFTSVPLPTTDTGGDATMWLFPNGVSGTYTLSATPPAGSPFATTSLHNVEITTSTAVTITLATPISLSGRVMDSEGGGIAGQRVVLTPVGGTERGTVITDDSGQYSFQVAPGDYNIRIASYNENAYSPASENAPTYYKLGTTTPISLTESTVLDIPLPEHRVSVHVQDTASNPVAGVALSTQGVYNTNLSVGSSPAYGYSFYFISAPLPTTDTGGDATMWLFPNGVSGTYTLSATPPAGSPFATTSLHNVEITTSTAVTITLATPISLSGRVMDSEGGGIAGQR